MDNQTPGRGMGRNSLEYCYCPKCDYKEEHQRGVPCTEKKCPKCGAQMVGEICKV